MSSAEYYNEMNSVWFSALRVLQCAPPPSSSERVRDLCFDRTKMYKENEPRRGVVCVWKIAKRSGDDVVVRNEMNINKFTEWHDTRARQRVRREPTNTLSLSLSQTPQNRIKTSIEFIRLLVTFNTRFRVSPSGHAVFPSARNTCWRVHLNFSNKFCDAKSFLTFPLSTPSNHSQRTRQENRTRRASLPTDLREGTDCDPNQSIWFSWSPQKKQQTHTTSVANLKIACKV